MTETVFDFTWYKDRDGYRAVPASRLSLEMPMADVQPARIARLGGQLDRYEPLRIGGLFERFARIATPEEVLRFVEKYGPLTQQGLRGKGDVVEEVIAEAKDMRGRVSKSLGKLNVSVDSTGNETRLRVRPASLLDALWLQYAQAGTRSRQCRQCGMRFLVGADAGRRADAEYCSDECRVRFNSLKRSRRG